ncbi:acyl CoA binding protein [Ancylostoma ceylanicum]|uniref:Acyl CoA binding protein n=2 Tax=Ancylostoma ceylanicum TaxID=53326 RepID=A0A0D6LUY6_9BILA|nr:acyl CoA binding protein [Ancylostoma ceylanicum]EYB98735.1 hypothetical protein Y032_0128g1420 [Ancylostoma ceylanicum]
MRHSLEEQFNAAVEIIQNLPKQGPIQPTMDQKLKMYGFFKQATVGQCNKEKPYFFNVEERLKWNAWNALGNMPKEEAMAEYVELLLATCEKAENEHNIDDFLNDPALKEIVELEPMFRKVSQRF